jgi:hypothetical protein
MILMHLFQFFQLWRFAYTYWCHDGDLCGGAGGGARLRERWYPAASCQQLCAEQGSAPVSVLTARMARAVSGCLSADGELAQVALAEVVACVSTPGSPFVVPQHPVVLGLLGRWRPLEKVLWSGSRGTLAGSGGEVPTGEQVAAFVSQVHALWGGAASFSTSASSLLAAPVEGDCESALRCLAWLHRPQAPMWPTPAPFQGCCCQRAAFRRSPSPAWFGPTPTGWHLLRCTSPDWLGSLLRPTATPSLATLCSTLTLCFATVGLGHGVGPPSPSLWSCLQRWHCHAHRPCPRTSTHTLSSSARTLCGCLFDALPTSQMGLDSSVGAAIVGATGVDVGGTLAQHRPMLDSGVSPEVVVHNAKCMLFLLHACMTCTEGGPGLGPSLHAGRRGPCHLARPGTDLGVGAGSGGGG